MESIFYLLEIIAGSGILLLALAMFMFILMIMRFTYKEDANAQAIRLSLKLAIKDIERLKTIYTRENRKNYKRNDMDLMESTHCSIKNILNRTLEDLLYTSVYEKVEMRVIDFNETIKNMSKDSAIKKVDTFFLFERAISMLIYSLKVIAVSEILKKFRFKKL